MVKKEGSTCFPEEHVVNSMNIPVLCVLLLLWDRFTQDRSGTASLSPAVYTVPSDPPLLLLRGAQEVQSTSLWEDRVYFHLELCCGVKSLTSVLVMF